MRTRVLNFCLCTYPISKAIHSIWDFALTFEFVLAQLASRRLATFCAVISLRKVVAIVAGSWNFWKFCGTKNIAVLRDRKQVQKIEAIAGLILKSYYFRSCDKKTRDKKRCSFWYRKR